MQGCNHSHLAGSVLSSASNEAAAQEAAASAAQKRAAEGGRAGAGSGVIAAAAAQVAHLAAGWALRCPSLTAVSGIMQRKKQSFACCLDHIAPRSGAGVLPGLSRRPVEA